MLCFNKAKIFEVLKNQADLEIITGQDIDSMRFFFTISTGSEKSFRVLFTSESSFGTELCVLEGVREFFETVNHFGEHNSSNRSLIKHLMDLMSGLIEKPVLDESTYFSLGLIEMILDDLKQFHVVQTQKWFSGKEIQWDEVAV